LSRSKLKYSYDLEKNSKRSEGNAYGYGAGAGAAVPGTLKAVTMDQDFFVILTENYSNRSNDDKEVVALKAIYDDMETIYQDFVSSKLGINSTVLLVSDISLDEPEKISENTIAVKATFIVRHRQPLT
jgi:hypothetical protein